MGHIRNSVDNINVINLAVHNYSLIYTSSPYILSYF